MYFLIEKIDRLCHKASKSFELCGRDLKDELSLLPHKTRSDTALAEKFLKQLSVLQKELFTLINKKNYKLIDKAKILIYAARWNKEIHLASHREKNNLILDLTESLQKIIKDEIYLNYHNRYLQILAEMKGNLEEFIKKSHHKKHPLIQKISDILTKQDFICDLEIHLHLVSSKLLFYLPSVRKQSLNSITGFFAKRFGKNGIYHQQISLFNDLRQSEKILTHHLRRIEKNPCHIISPYPFSDRETKIETKSKNLDGKPQSYYLNLTGVPTKKENISNPRATYPMRAKNQVKHYSNTSDNIEGNEGAFADIMKTIVNAKKIIFICGWLFEPQSYIINKKTYSKTLGEILVNKAIAQPDLEIAILVWGQTPTHEHHMEAYDYLKKMAISRGLYHLPFNLQWRRVFRTGFSWTHHQKFIIADTPDQLVAFYGSADLANGKFDCHQHHILDTYENKSVVSSVFGESGLFVDSIFVDKKNDNYELMPRLPWREVLSQIKGPVVQDFLVEFVSRWQGKKQGALSEVEGSTDAHHRVLKKFQKIRRDPLLKCLNTSDTQGKFIWNAQLVRSSESCMYAVKWDFPQKKYEKSIHKAYLQAIAQEDDFIYIENQYLTQDNPKQSKNRIPQALVNRIVERHTAGQPFHIFIVLPLLPNGEPGGKIFVEPVRYLQWKTMRWMMEEIEKRTGIFWGTYISFFFFGKWLKKTDDYSEKFENTKTTRAELTTCSGHATVYNHAKLALFGDRAIINGSANLTERSLAGPLDSETAVYQVPMPGYKAACKEEARQFRKKIWTDYFGEDCLKVLGEKGFQNPHLPENISIIQSRAKQNLKSFMIGYEPSNARTGLLLTWPFKRKKGCIGEMEPHCEFLPETLLKDIDKETEIFRWFPTLKSKPTALKVASTLGHKGFN